MGQGGTIDAGQRDVLEHIARGFPLQDVLEEIIRLIESQAEEMLCSILLLDFAAQRVSSSIAPSLPPAFVAQLVGLPIGPNAGSCGAAMFCKERVVVEDIASHPNWAPYRDLALPHGLRACWSSPILSPEGEALGSYAIYYATPRGPSERELAWVDLATHLASIAILRERSSRALEQSEKRLRAVVANTPNVAIQWYDADARLLSFNPASRALFGWTDACLGKTLLELGFWSSAEETRFRAAITATEAKQELDPSEFSFTRPDGTDGFLLSTIFSVPADDGQNHYVCMDIDLTERRRLENQLNQAQRLSALGTLAGGIAHDFNNILLAIQGNAELASLAVGQGHRASGSVRQIQTAAERASQLVSQILTFARKQAPRREPMDLRLAVEEALRLVSVSVPAHVRLTTSFSDDAPQVAADAVQVHQVIMNLITNATHALRDGGQIDVSLTLYVVEPDSPSPRFDLGLGSYAVVTVADNGSGMDERTRSQVFEPFFTTKPVGRGTGLGLSVVHGIMKAHGGTVDVTSQPGVGSTFRLFFPARVATAVQTKAAQAQVMQATAAQEERTESSRVLFIDDDESLVFLAERMLSRQGLKMTTHCDPRQALEDFQERVTDFDIVITDVSMPGLSGPDLVSKIRALRSDIPIVMITGFVTPEQERAVEGLGNVDLVLKPTTIDAYVGLLGPLVNGYCNGSTARATANRF